MAFSKPQIKVEEQILEDLMNIINSNKNKSPWHRPWTPTNQGNHTNFLTNHFKWMHPTVISYLPENPNTIIKWCCF